MPSFHIELNQEAISNCISAEAAAERIQLLQNVLDCATARALSTKAKGRKVKAGVAWNADLRELISLAKQAGLDATDDTPEGLLATAEVALKAEIAREAGFRNTATNFREDELRFRR